MLIIANLILVSHSVLPHHHHQGIICIKAHDHHEDNEAHSSLPFQNSNNETNCSLKQNYLPSISKTVSSSQESKEYSNPQIDIFLKKNLFLKDISLSLFSILDNLFKDTLPNPEYSEIGTPRSPPVL